MRGQSPECLGIAVQLITVDVHFFNITADKRRQVGYVVAPEIDIPQLFAAAQRLQAGDSTPVKSHRFKLGHSLKGIDIRYLRFIEADVSQTPAVGYRCDIRDVAVPEKHRFKLRFPTQD